jgi:hypothetical protein
MAENKRSFLLYTDLIHTVEKMKDNKAGVLFKTILAYVNDKNPVVDDVIIDLVFEPIKQQLKRDLDKWDKIKEKRSEAGKASADKKKQQNPTNSTCVESVEQTSTNSTVSVNDNVTVNVNDTVINNNTHIKPKPDSEDLWLELPEINIGSVIQLMQITKQIKLNTEQVKEFWTVFKIQYFTGEKFYQSEKDVFSHFTNWMKGQNVNNAKRINTTQAKPGTRSESGQISAIEDLRRAIELERRREEGLADDVR